MLREMTKIKRTALPLEILSVEVNLLWGLVFKDYFYALDNQTYAVKSLQLWLAVLFVSLEKL